MTAPTGLPVPAPSSAAPIRPVSVSVFPGDLAEPAHRPLDARTIELMSASSRMYAVANLSYSPTSC